MQRPADFRDFPEDASGIVQPARGKITVKFADPQDSGGQSKGMMLKPALTLKLSPRSTGRSF